MRAIARKKAVWTKNSNDSMLPHAASQSATPQFASTRILELFRGSIRKPATHAGNEFNRLIIIINIISSKNEQCSKTLYRQSTYMNCVQTLHILIHSNCGQISSKFGILEWPYNTARRVGANFLGARANGSLCMLDKTNRRLYAPLARPSPIPPRPRWTPAIALAEISSPI